MVGLIAACALTVWLGITGNLDPVVGFLQSNGKTLLKVAQIVGLFVAGYIRNLRLAVTLIITLLATEFCLE